MESKTIIRVQKNVDYTVINNTSINDERLSWKAKAIHVFMLSKPDDWTFYNEELQQWAKDGKSSFDSGLAELKKLGYVKKERRRDEDGKFQWITVVYEVPQIAKEKNEKPPSEKPCMENRCMDEQSQLNQGFEQPSDNSPYPEKPLMENPSMEKPSVEKPLMENQQLLSTDALSTESLSTDKENVVVVGDMPEQENEQQNQNVFEFYQQNGFGMSINSITLQKIDAWCQDLSDELVIHAMQIAIERNSVSWSYAEGIMRKWSAKNVKTIADVNALIAQFEASRQKSKPHYKPKRDERIPDWFPQHQAQAQGITTPPPIEQPVVDFEAERAKILAKLGQAQG